MAASSPVVITARGRENSCASNAMSPDVARAGRARLHAAQRRRVNTPWEIATPSDVALDAEEFSLPLAVITTGELAATEEVEGDE